MSTGWAIFVRAEEFYHAGKMKDALDNYQRAIKKILKDEIVIAKVPMPVTHDDMPRETLGMAWRNFVGFFRDPAMSFNEQTAPEAYKLLNSFRPTVFKGHDRLERTERGRILSKGMQITAGLTLGLLAWDKRDRATAAKRYNEALELAKTHAPFNVLPPGTVGFEKWVYTDLQQTKDNLANLIEVDVEKAELLEGYEPKRKEAIPLPIIRSEGTGAMTFGMDYTFATSACGKCGKRDVKLMRCSRCKSMTCESFFPYLFPAYDLVVDCSVECQKADWK
jgi:hypothetical protein